MRIYDNCKEMHGEVRRDLHEMGTKVHPQTMQDMDVRDNPDFQTLELSPCVFTILNGDDRDIWINDLGLNLEYCIGEFSDRVGSLPLNPGNAWKLRESTWAPFIHDGKFSYTYPERFNMLLEDENGNTIPFGPRNLLTPLSAVVNQLVENPNTRQAILPVFNSLMDLPNVGGVKRIPCSLHYQFMIREEGLRCTYVMRSTDFKTHFPYDIWLALELQSHLANLIGQPIGHFTFFTGSLHLYAKDADPGVF